jgi:hypothetical protein
MHPRPGRPPGGPGRPSSGRLQEPRGRAARPGAQPCGNRVPCVAATAGWRCPAPRASPPGVPARASARTWDRRAGQTCPPARDLSLARRRFRARTPIRTGLRPPNQGLDRRGEPCGCGRPDRPEQGRGGRRVGPTAQGRRPVRADVQGQVPWAGQPRGQNRYRNQGLYEHRSHGSDPRPGHGARLRLRRRRRPPRRGARLRPGCGPEWAGLSLSGPGSSRR